MSVSTLFIPDISGFTRFVKSTDIHHSAHIIEELLTLIIKEGSKHFEVAEIEGDAVFFYKHKEKLSVKEVSKIAKDIYIAFNKHLKRYEFQRICNCGACTSTVDLKLKFIVHSGEVTFTKLGTGNRPKPFGSDVIVLHKLMKNDISYDEYILFSEAFIGEEACEMDGNNCYIEADLGKIPYQYLVIENWMKDVQLNSTHLKIETIDLEVEVSKEINFSAPILHEFITDLKYRHYWNKGIDEIIFDEKMINREGTEHVCIVNGKNLRFEAIKLKVDEHIQAYGEVLKRPMAPFKFFEIDFLMVPISGSSTDFHVKMKAKFKWYIFNFFKGMIKKKTEERANFLLSSIVDSVQEHIKDGVIV